MRQQQQTNKTSMNERWCAGFNIWCTSDGLFFAMPSQKDVPLVGFMYLVFTRMPGESYHKRLRSLLLCLCDVFRVVITSLVCWFELKGPNLSEAASCVRSWSMPVRSWYMPDRLVLSVQRRHRKHTDKLIHGTAVIIVCNWLLCKKLVHDRQVGTFSTEKAQDPQTNWTKAQLQLIMSAAGSCVRSQYMPDKLVLSMQRRHGTPKQSEPSHSCN